MTFEVRNATAADLPALRSLMADAIDSLQSSFLSPAQIAASRAIMGLDTQLVSDGTYLIAEQDGIITGCGGWSRRATLYGGDHSASLRNATRLDPSCDAARVRAMFTDPKFARRGIGRIIVDACEAAARREGFSTAELMATLSGEPPLRRLWLSRDRGGRGGRGRRDDPPSTDGQGHCAVTEGPLLD